MTFRSVGRALATAAVSVGLLVASPGIANAVGEWSWSDGFEGADPYERWAFDWGGTMQFSFPGPGWARSGNANAYLPENDDFVAVRTTLPIAKRIFEGTDYECVATAWVMGVESDTGKTVSTVGIEVIDDPSWTGMAEGFQQISGGTWTQISTGYWSSGDETPTLRVVLGKDSAPIRVDDVEAYCNSWTLL